MWRRHQPRHANSVTCLLAAIPWRTWHANSVMCLLAAIPWRAWHAGVPKHYAMSVYFLGCCWENSNKTCGHLNVPATLLWLARWSLLFSYAMRRPISLAGTGGMLITLWLPLTRVTGLKYTDRENVSHSKDSFCFIRISLKVCSTW